MSHCEHCGFSTDGVKYEAENLISALDSISSFTGETEHNPGSLYWLFHNLTMPLALAMEVERKTEKEETEGGGS